MKANVFPVPLRLCERPFRIFFFGLFFFPAALYSQEWYRSNQSGMALEKTSSRITALHFEWALSVEKSGYTALPALLRKYYNSSYTLEQRLLYERGSLKRRQWIFRGGGVTRVNASLPADLSTIGKTGGGEVPPFVEIFSPHRTLIETHQYLPAGVYTTRYAYQEGLLIKADTFLDNVPLWTDSYRYTRSSLLRGVERKYHEAGAYAEPLQGTNSRPPVTPPANLDLRDAPPIPGFVSPVSPYDNSIMTQVLESIYAVRAARVSYETDGQGRVITETRYNEDDEVLALIANEWTNDKLTVIKWSAPPDEGRVVFRYSGNNRISEEDYRNGILERRVKAEGDEEIEEIFMNNKVILRALWKDGRKISEERPR